MTPVSAQRRIADLRAQVARHDELYYRRSQPEISDFDYDQLKRALADLEAQFPQFASAESPTQRVGDDRAQGFKEVAHRQKMLSLDNTYNEAELRAFHARLARLLGNGDLRYTVEPKIDGLAVSLTYEEGRFIRAVTRGRGDRGDDVTANVGTIHSLPKQLAKGEGRGAKGDIPRIVEIRGEIYLTAAEFERINAERAAAGEELYANPRNLAAGTIKQLDFTEVARRKLELVLYGLGYCAPARGGSASRSRSASPASSARSPSWSRCCSPAAPSAGRRCTTRTRSAARTSASATWWKLKRPARSSRRCCNRFPRNGQKAPRSSISRPRWAGSVRCAAGRSRAWRWSRRMPRAWRGSVRDRKSVV